MDSKPKASVLKTKLNQRELFHVNLKVILIWHHRWYPISDNRTLRCSKSLYEALYWRVTLKHCSAAILSFQNFHWGSMDGTGVRVLTSHHCGPGLIPGSGVYCWYLSLLQGKKQLSKFQFHLETTEKKCHLGGISFAQFTLLLSLLLKKHTLLLQECWCCNISLT